MTRILCLWPLDTTYSLAADVERLFTRSCDAEHARHFTSRTGALEYGAPGVAVSRLFRDLVPLMDPAPALHCFIVVPLYDARCVEAVRSLAGDIDACPMPVTLCVIGLREWLRDAVGDSQVCDPREDEGCMARIAEISDVVESVSAPSNFTVLDDFLASGAPVRFTRESLARFMAEFFRVVVDNYTDIYTASVYQQSGLITGLGFASIEFPRREFVQFLMRKAFAAALEQADLSDTSVDLATANAEAARILDGFSEYFERFYNEKVVHQQRLGVDVKKICSDISNNLKADTQTLYDRFCSHIYRADAGSLPQRRATLALILGQDDPALHGMSSGFEGIFDDAFSQPLKVFIDASRSLAGYMSQTLPVRGKYQALRLPPIGKDDKGKPIPNPENKLPFDPLPDLRALRQLIIELTGSIRRNEERLGELRQSMELRNNSENLHHGGNNPDTHRGRNTVAEVSLEVKYSPSPELQPAPSVDLRSFFGPVLSQGEMPACSSFASIALYEALANRHIPAGKEKIKLSEAYLFYHTPERTKGSNFRDQFELMARLGSCPAGMYPYSEESLRNEPSPEATTAALDHRLLSAREIPLTRTDNRFNDIEANHRIITSALAEGFPVGISLRIPKDFGSDGPYINRPSQELIESPGGLSNHAMVVVGYVESDKFYILRNSWGKKFGEDGYCYVSAAYIDDPALNNFCCIVDSCTDSTAAEPQSEENLPTVTRLYDSQELIDYHSLLNTIEWSRLRLQDLTARFDVLYGYFRDLIDTLSMSTTRRELTSVAKDGARSALSYARNTEQNLRGEMSGHMSAVAIRFAKSAAAAITGAGLLTFLLCYLGLDLSPASCAWITLASVVGSIAFALSFYYGYLRKRKRRDYFDRINECASGAGAIERLMSTIDLEFFAAGEVIEMLKDVRMQLYKTYSCLRSFCNRLKEWQAEYAAQTHRLETGSDPKFRILGDRALLESFFNSEVSNIVGTFDFMAAFSDYLADTRRLPEIRRELEEKAMKVVSPSLDSYSISDHILGNQYPYLPSLDIQSLLMEFNQLARPMLRSIGAPAEETRIIIAAHRDRPKWAERLRAHLSHRLHFLQADSKDTLTIVSLIFLPRENLL